MVISVLVGIFVWWIIGTIGFLLCTKYFDGEVLLGDLVLSVGIGFFGPLLPLVACIMLFVIKIKELLAKHKETKIW